MKGRFLFEREYVGYTGSLTHIARGIDRLAGEEETGEWIGVDGVWDAFVEQVLRPIEKLELAAVNMLKLAEEVDEDNPLLKSRLRQEGTQLLKYIQQHSGNYSLQREFLIGLLEANG